MRIAVVIPTLHEAERVQDAIHSALVDQVDVLVSDGGSRDATREIARDAGARVIASPPGRALQLQTGFEAAQEADVVMFLHADTVLPRGWADALRHALADPAVVGGAFGFRFLEEGRRERVVEWGVDVRMRRFALPYGDQAIFARRPALEAVGGIPQVPIMEDVDLVQRLRGHGRLVQLPLSVRTSSRRYREHGFARMVVRNFLAVMARALAVDRAAIARWYRR
ncbi:MAG: TIGR04283 family arsenosugar biosynthesis glycosyltransferase [Myxococcota bacterium]|nr:TIGR04283 family arsenosugar biosynthesis glycosyltransferase [Myxococcota bacterium]